MFPPRRTTKRTKKKERHAHNRTSQRKEDDQNKHQAKLPDCLFNWRGKKTTDPSFFTGIPSLHSAARRSIGEHHMTEEMCLRITHRCTMLEDIFCSLLTKLQIQSSHLDEGFTLGCHKWYNGPYQDPVRTMGCLWLCLGGLPSHFWRTSCDAHVRRSRPNLSAAVAAS